ncbi:hypothetical protein [uncultured Methylobacterium sp.]|jgi:hypothetical protein|uniref:hypothetical protein n=1 Tax=uncultured Methylobacterium sp. TaxID=157278 RepID=UPI00262A867F|nr:hypothetical protein [uncultured Methylobacterium sp.]
MNDATPREVAWHFGIAAALSLSTVAAPFVPEAITVYAGYRYLRHFTYGWRTWRAPARIPKHLGAQGYRDETTRRPGDATWPLGLGETGQVWLRREDLMQGLALYGDDPEWRVEAIGTLVFGACYNGHGAIVIQNANDEMLTDQLIKIAAPFGRDLEVRAFNLIEAPQPPLRISTETITAAIADLGLGPEAIAVNAAMLPILRMLAERYGESLLKLYPTYLETEAFNKLLKGVYEFNGKDVKANDLSSSDAAALKKVIEPLNELLDVEREKGRLALIGFAGELATLACVSLGSGVELRTALSAGALMCIRPYSTLSAALVIARCNEALTALAPERAGHTLVHIAYPDDLSGASAQAFREAAVKAGAIGSLSFPKRAASHVYKATRKLCALQIRSTKIRRVKETRSGRIVSALKDCPFVLDIQFPAAELDNRENV